MHCGIGNSAEEHNRPMKSLGMHKVAVGTSNYRTGRVWRLEAARRLSADACGGRPTSRHGEPDVGLTKASLYSSEIRMKS